MKTEPNEPIAPSNEWANVPSYGLTKREYFAGLAMQGIASNSNIKLSPKDLAEWSIKCADELIKQLNHE